MKRVTQKTRDIEMVNKFIRRTDIEIEAMIQLIYILNLTKKEKFECVEALRVIDDKNQKISGKKLRNIKKHIHMKKLRKCYTNRGL